MLYINNLARILFAKPVSTFAEYAHNQKHQFCALSEN